MLNGQFPISCCIPIADTRASVNPASSEAFIARLYREKNKNGFLKAFTDQPEHITSGMSPLRVILKELQLRTVHIYPRFHQDISESLGRDRSVLQLSVDMTEYMSEIHVAIVQCMSTTLSELKRSNTQVCLSLRPIYATESAPVRSRRPERRKHLLQVFRHDRQTSIGPSMAQGRTANETACQRFVYFTPTSGVSTTHGFDDSVMTYRRLLLTEDALAFQQYLEGLIDANTTNEAGNAKHNQSPWMLTEAANVIFQYAKRRCFTIAQKSKTAPVQQADEHEDEWEALRELEGGAATNKSEWPEGMQPVLEELPKWSLVAAALLEIEEEMIRRETKLTARAYTYNFTCSWSST